MKITVKTYIIINSGLEVSVIRVVPHVSTMSSGHFVFHKGGAVWNMSDREFSQYIDEAGYTLKETKEV